MPHGNNYTKEALETQIKAQKSERNFYYGLIGLMGAFSVVATLGATDVMHTSQEGFYNNHAKKIIRDHVSAQLGTDRMVEEYIKTRSDEQNPSLTMAFSNETQVTIEGEKINALVADAYKKQMDSERTMGGMIAVLCALSMGLGGLSLRRENKTLRALEAEAAALAGPKFGPQ